MQRGPHTTSDQPMVELALELGLYPRKLFQVVFGRGPDRVKYARGMVGISVTLGGLFLFRFAASLLLIFLIEISRPFHPSVLGASWQRNEWCEAIF